MNGKKVFTNFLWRFFERISAQLVTFIVSIVLARLLAPEDYGVISILLIFITFANILVCNGFATALIQKKDSDDLDFSSVFYFTLFFSIVIYIVIFISAPYFAKWYGMPILTPTLRVISIRIIIGAVNSVQQSYVSKKMIFKKFFLATLGGTILSAIVGIAMGFLGFGVWALVMQYLVNTTVDTIVLWFTVKWRPKKMFSFKRLKKLLSYGWKLLASALIGSLYDDLRTLIIGKVYSNEDLAYYSRGQQFPKLIINNVNSSVTSVMFPAISSIQDNFVLIQKTHRKTIQVVSGLISPIMFGMAAVSSSLIFILLGEKWMPSVPYLQLFSMLYLITSIYTMNLQVYKALGRSGLALLIELVDDIIGIILLLALYKKGVLFVAIVTVVSKLLASLICIPINKKILHLNVFIQLKDMFKPVIASIIMFIAVYYIGMIKINMFLLLILQVIVGIVLYIIFSYVFKLEYINIVINMIKNHKKAGNTNDK